MVNLSVWLCDSRCHLPAPPLSVDEKAASRTKCPTETAPPGTYPEPGVSVSFGHLRNIHYAVAISAASSRPISLMEISRILYFWVLPLMVMGKASTNLT